MSKFKKATKRITAVAASAALVSSAVFGAGLSSYPNNFVEDGSFMGQVVVGASAAASDSTAAASIIDDLRDEFSGSNEKVKITYRSSSSGGETLNAVKTNSQLNYGEKLGDVSETNGFDSSDSDYLQDEDFDNGVSDEEYEQTLQLSNGNFSYALRDEVEGIDEITDGIFYDNDDTFATYTLDLKNAINLSSATNSDMVGKTLTIMGNDFTIGSFTKSSTSGDLTKLELLGGSNKVSLGEGESTTVSVDGESYEVSVQSVSTDKVLLTVNGQSESIDEYDVETVAGVSVAVTDLVDSSRDTVKGYAELVIGGQKITLDDDNAKVKVNDDDVDDIYSEYEVTSDFSDNAGMDTITITYKVAEETLLQSGDSLRDVLFDTFEIIYRGTNDVSYSVVKLSENDDDISITGTSEAGYEFDRDFIHTTSTSGTNGVTYLKGDQDADRIFYEGSLYLGTSITGVTLYNTTAGTTFYANNDALNAVTFNFSRSQIDGSGIFMYKDLDDQYLYEIDSVDTNDAEVDVVEALAEKDKSELKPSEFRTDLEETITGAVVGTDSVNVTLASGGSLDTPQITFENQLIMNFATVEALGTAGNITFSLDGDDLDVDTNTDDDESWVLGLTWDSTDSKFNFALTADNQFANANDADIEDGNSDVKEYVTIYGTKIRYDEEDDEWIEIHVPDEQVMAEVDLVFGAGSSQDMTVTVDADMADDKVEELEDDGMTVVSRETMESEEVDFDVESVVMDSDVTGASDMIVVGGPAVNSVAAELLGLAFPTYGSDSGVDMDEAVVQYFSEQNSVLVYGYEAKDTTAAAEKLNAGGLSGDLVNVE